MGKLTERELQKFNEKQRLAIEILAKPARGGMTYLEIAEYVGCDEKTLYRWRQNPEFAEVVTKRAMMNIAEDLPEVFNANLKRAKSGEVRSVELLYKLLGLLITKSEVEVEDKTSKDTDTMKAEIDAMREKLGL